MNSIITDPKLRNYITNNQNLQQLNVKLMKKIIKLEREKDLYADRIVVMEKLHEYEEWFRLYIKNGFSHESPF